MAGIPQNFQAISNVLPTYNFADIVAGTGYVNFYAGNTVDLKLLSNFTYYSDVVLFQDASWSDTNYAKQQDIDFDVLINRPLLVKGKGIINVPLGLSADGTAYGYITARLRKWDGVTETEICTNDSSVSSKNGTSVGYSMKSIDLDVPLTLFKIGEYLRLTIEVWAKRVAGSYGYTYLGNDPMNRTTGWDTTGAVPSRLLFQCPVRLNL